jgi:hypothetical protein
MLSCLYSITWPCPARPCTATCGMLVSFDRLEVNPVPKAAGDAVAALFAHDPPSYMERGPFCYADPARKKQKGQWSEYEKRFLDLMISRRIEETISRETIDGACLPCSEGKPDDYLKNKWGDLNIVHL